MILLVYQFVVFRHHRSSTNRQNMDMRPWSFALFLTLILLGNIFVVSFGAPYDFSRLLFPILPAFMLLCVLLPALVSKR